MTTKKVLKYLADNVRLAVGLHITTLDDEVKEIQIIFTNGMLITITAKDDIIKATMPEVVKTL